MVLKWLKLVVVAAAIIGAATAEAQPLRVAVGSEVGYGPEGLWQIPGGALFRITAQPGHAGCFDIIAIDAATPDVPTCTVVGQLRLGPDRYKADASLLTDMSTGRSRQRMADYGLTFSQDYKSVKFDRYRRGIVVDIVRALPYLFRPGYQRADTRPEGLDGAIKLPALPAPVQL